MAITYLQGDLLKAPVRAIAHGVNAKGKMGKGFAKQLRAAYPGAYTFYMDRYQSQGLSPGDVVAWKGGNRTVLHCVTQDGYGNDGGQYVSYDAVRECMRKIERAARHHVATGDGVFAKERVLGMPKIGSALGGGDWNRIAAIIEEEVRTIDVQVYVFGP